MTARFIGNGSVPQGRDGKEKGQALCFVFPSSRSARALGLAQAAEGKIRNKIFSHLFSLFSS